MNDKLLYVLLLYLVRYAWNNVFLNLEVAEVNRLRFWVL